MQDRNDTICAPITPMQAAAVGVIRISGPDAFAAARTLFSRPDSIRHGRAVYGALRDAAGAPLDDCVLTAFAGPRSYTGEDVVELSCHGSPTVLRLALRALGRLGVRMAQPGEFTRRAFVNGKLDLTRAEAIMELIEADTRREAAAAGAHLRGSTARRIEALRDRLLTIAASISAYVDFPDDEIEQTDADGLDVELGGIEAEARLLLRGYDAGRLVKEGVRTAIAGRTNAGKSSLMNLLSGGEHSIVTDAPGTTRDIVERQVSAGGVKLILQDTAGLRRARAEAEKIGVARSLDAVDAAALVLCVFDCSRPLHADDRLLTERTADKDRIAVLNKCDLPVKIDLKYIQDNFKHIVYTSALRGTGMDELGACIARMYLHGAPADADLLFSERQFGCLERMAAAVESARRALRAGVTLDAVGVLIDDAIASAGEITGANVSEDTVRRIFERFCVGK